MKAWALNQLIRRALSEDAANNDITTKALIPKHHVSRARIIIKEDAVVNGVRAVEHVFKLLDPRIRLETIHTDGAKVKRNTVVIKLKGKTRAILTGERVALNFLGYLSGIATDTRKFVQKTRGTNAGRAPADVVTITPWEFPSSIAETGAWCRIRSRYAWSHPS